MRERPLQRAETCAALLVRAMKIDGRIVVSGRVLGSIASYHRCWPATPATSTLPIADVTAERSKQESSFMPMNKPHLEFHKIDMNNGWATPPGYPAGIEQKILASDLDETRKMGSRTRLLRFDPGVYTTAPFVHDHWEEVYLVSGDLIVGNDTQGKGGEPFDAPTYACRPPGVYHGPFKSERGCLLYEIHYYDESRK